MTGETTRIWIEDGHARWDGWLPADERTEAYHRDPNNQRCWDCGVRIPWSRYSHFVSCERCWDSRPHQPPIPSGGDR